MESYKAQTEVEPEVEKSDSDEDMPMLESSESGWHEVNEEEVHAVEKKGKQDQIESVINDEPLISKGVASTIALLKSRVSSLSFLFFLF